MNATHSGEYVQDVYFIHSKMFIRTTHKLPVLVNHADDRRRRNERNSQLRGWDDDGGAQPEEHAKE